MLSIGLLFLIIASGVGVLTAIGAITGQIRKNKERKRKMEEFEREHPSGDLENNHL